MIAGSHASDDDVARWAYRVRAATGQLPTALFRRSQRASRMRNAAGASVLPDAPFGAQRHLLAVVDGRRDEPGDTVVAQPLINAPREARA